MFPTNKVNLLLLSIFNDIWFIYKFWKEVVCFPTTCIEITYPTCSAQIGINITVQNRNLVLFSLIILHVCNVSGTTFICMGVTVGKFVKQNFARQY